MWLTLSREERACYKDDENTLKDHLRHSVMMATIEQNHVLRPSSPISAAFTRFAFDDSYRW